MVWPLVLAAAVAFALVGPAPTADGQPSPKVHRIGYLATGSSTSGFHTAFVEGLRELGWIEGRNVIIDYRFAEGKFDRLPALATELVRSDVEILVAQPTPAALAARNATRSIPIVMINVGDPVGVGLVASLAHPAGNVTGTAFDVGLETFGKALELLKEAVPSIRRVAVLTNPANPAQGLAIKNLKAAAQSLRLKLLLLEARRPEDFDGLFAQMVSDRVDAVFIVAESMFYVHRTRLAELALKNRLPSMYGLKEAVEAGGLVSYGPSLAYNSRRAATFVDKILKGARPADLPVEQPTKFELVVNLEAAKTLGLTIPPALLRRADAVVQ